MNRLTTSDSRREWWPRPSSSHRMSWLRSTDMRGAFLVAALMLLAPAALAQDKPDHVAKGMQAGCEAFKWPLDKERSAFADPNIAKASSGAAQGAFQEQSFLLELQPVSEVRYTLAPAKKNNADEPRFGGVVAFAAPETPAVYQVTLSSEGWIDLVQEGKALDSTDHSGAKNCPGLRKSVRFKVGAAPVVFEISGAPAGTIMVAIRAAE